MIPESYTIGNFKVIGAPQAIASAFVGARSIKVCHLMNLAYRYHTDLEWNPVPCTFAKGSEHPEKWLTRDYRGEWQV